MEHVLPRNIQEDSHWLTVWPDPAKRREQCDTLGNFVLLTHKVNQKADRLDYRAKKEVYFNGGGGLDFARPTWYANGPTCWSTSCARCGASS